MPLNILIADDEAHIRTLLYQTLEDLEAEGVSIAMAEDGLQALDYIEKERPALVLLDVMMPEMTGLEVCREVKLLRKISDVNIVLLTAKGQEIDRHNGAMAGANQYITKPFDPDQVLALARKVLDLP